MPSRFPLLAPVLRSLPSCVALATVLGCAPKVQGDALRDVSFEGNRPAWFGLVRPQTDRALTNAMAHPPARGWIFFGALRAPWVDPVPVDGDALDADARRIEVWYAEHGYFDARFLGWEIKGPRRKAGDLRPVRIVGYVEEGEPSTVRTLAWEGMERLQAPTRRRLQRAFGLAQGDVFASGVYQASLDALRAGLVEQSYAHARVEGQVDVYPDDHRVDVTVRTDPGPRCRFGAITFSDFDGVPRRIVEDAVAFEEGDAFRASKLAETRAKLFALQAFSVVNVVPDLSDPTSGVVPIRIDVRVQDKFRELELGAGVEIETGQGETFVEVAVSDKNVANRLWRGEVRVRPGIGALTENPSLWFGGDVLASPIVPVGEAGARLEIPYAGGPAWTFNAEGTVELGLERGYRFFAPELSPTITWKRGEELIATAGWTLRYFDYFDATVDISTIEDSPLKLDLTDPYLLSMLVQSVTWDGRNDPLYTTRGWFWRVATGEAGGVVGGNFQFVRAEAEARAYRSVVRLFGQDPNTVLAGRVGAGLIVPYGAKAGVPYAERLYVGGGTTVRGWADKRLGPWIETTQLESGETEVVPAGGEVELFGNAEIRQRMPILPDVSLAAFTDVGRVWDRPANFGWDELQWSVGGGLRYRTPIGPVRFDVGVRLGDAEYFAREPRVAYHFGLSEAF